ncbi:MAG: DUF1569 domain-containing protein [Rhodothermales bacterium]|nr:DUF1569 domain-containing protein [Rhodothermales bacterium]
MPTLVQRNLFEPAIYREFLARVEKITPETQPQWGKMNAAQMMAHCAEIQEVMNGKELKNTPFFVKLLKGVIRKAVTNLTPYPRNSRTHPQYIVADARDFAREKARFLAALDAMISAGPEKASQIPHSFFGPMTAEEKGWGMYKHHDHHLTQFGV